MIRCKWCKKEIILNGQNFWIHVDNKNYNCYNSKNKAEPEKFCVSCNEPQRDSEICGCGYKYEIREYTGFGNLSTDELNNTGEKIGDPITEI